MNLTAFELVSFKDEDEYINGIHYSLKVDQAIKIIEYFRSQNKWTEYYFHEVSNYYLSVEEVKTILNLESSFCIENNTMLDFEGFTINNNESNFDNRLVTLIQSYDKKDNKPNHFYICWTKDEQVINENTFSNGLFLGEDELRKFANKHRIFDTNNFTYRLDNVPMKELYFDSSAIESPIKLEPSPDYWNEEE